MGIDKKLEYDGEMTIYNGLIVTANDNMAKLLGYRQSFDLVGQKINNFVPQYLKDSMKTNNNEFIDFLFYNKFGEKVPVILTTGDFANPMRTLKKISVLDLRPTNNPLVSNTETMTTNE